MIDVTKTCENHQKEDTEITQFIQTNGNSFVLALDGIEFFLQCSQYKAVFWICAGNNVDKTEIFSLVLVSTYIQGLFCSSPHQ